MQVEGGRPSTGSARLTEPNSARPDTSAEGRLQYLESELVSFTAKMEEMRAAASNLQEEVRFHRPGSEPPSALPGHGSLKVPGPGSAKPGSELPGAHLPGHGSLAVPGPGSAKSRPSGGARSPTPISAWPEGGARSVTPMSVMRGVAAAMASSQSPGSTSATVQNGSAQSGGGGSSSVQSVESWVQNLQRSIRREESESRSLSVGPSVEELRQLRKELLTESEARRQALTKMENLYQDERRQREEAVRQEAAQRDGTAARLEQQWHTLIKEEREVRRAVEGHLEARLAAMQREVRLEVSSASSQNQQILGEFASFREGVRRELDIAKMEISTASTDLSRLVDQLQRSEARSAGGSLDGEQPAVDAAPPPLSAELTESLVRAEVRRQLSASDEAKEKSAGLGSLGAAASLDQAQAASRLDRLEKALQHEATSREESSSKLLATLHDHVAEGRQRLERGQLDLEQRLQARLEGVASEARAARQDCLTEQRERKAAMEQEVKEREEVLFMLLKQFEDKMTQERARFEEKLQEERSRTEDALCVHDRDVQRQIQATLEATVANYAEKSTKELLTTRQDLLELREELQESLRTEREGRDQAISRLGHSLQSAREDSHQPKSQEDVASLRDELRAEAMARKEDVQGVRCSIDRLREQVLAAKPSTVLEQPSSAGGGSSGSEDLRRAIESERQAREDADQQAMATVHDLLREERQTRERGYQALELRLQSEEQTIFVESGKREERDRDIMAQLAKVDEEFDTVKRQLTGTLQQRQRLDDVQQAHEAMQRKMEELAGRLKAPSFAQGEASTVPLLPRRSQQSSILYGASSQR